MPLVKSSTLPTGIRRALALSLRGQRAVTIGSGSPLRASDSGTVGHRRVSLPRGPRSAAYRLASYASPPRLWRATPTALGRRATWASSCQRAASCGLGYRAPNRSRECVGASVALKAARRLQSPRAGCTTVEAVSYFVDRLSAFAAMNARSRSAQASKRSHCAP